MIDMPEEITIAGQMNKLLSGKAITTLRIEISPSASPRYSILTPK